MDDDTSTNTNESQWTSESIYETWRTKWTPGSIYEEQEGELEEYDRKGVQQPVQKICQPQWSMALFGERRHLACFIVGIAIEANRLQLVKNVGTAVYVDCFGLQRFLPLQPHRFAADGTHSWSSVTCYLHRYRAAERYRKAVSDRHHDALVHESAVSDHHCFLPLSIACVYLYLHGALYACRFMYYIIIIKLIIYGAADS